MSFEKIEREKYDEQWSNAWYREKCHGLNLYEELRGVFPAQFKTAIDFGCGTGRLVKRWREEGIAAIGIDISPIAPDPDVAGWVQVEPLWQVAEWPPVDVGVCADVMEHIPPRMVALTLDRISKACDWCLFKIANFPSEDEGRVLHLTLHDRDWWVDELERYGVVSIVETGSPVEEYVLAVTFRR